MSKTRKEPPLFKKFITNNTEISPGVHVLSFKRDFDFKPGQVVKIGIDTHHPPRIYSICSGNRDNELQILFNIKEDGFLSPQMAKLKAGVFLWVSEPYGSFLGSADPAWLISTGTGIAPFYSMFRSGLSKNKKLIHGVSYLNQFYFEEELEQAMGENYIRCCSRESATSVFNGRVTEYIAGLKEIPPIKYFLCGKALMVVELRDLLIEKGIAYENILAEIYF